ncbi:MAG: class I SAM-dependent methyltransferase, partial [Terriglobia bacterium]
MPTLTTDPEFPLAEFITEVSPNDGMFSDPNHYLRVGLSALEIFEHAMTEGYIEETNIRDILDLPCGHGRVSRILRARFPSANLTVCDLDRDGVEFCAQRFDAVPVYSTKNFDDLRLSGPFDLIWVGSLITHLSASDTVAFLRCMARTLN